MCLHAHNPLDHGIAKRVIPFHLALLPGCDICYAPAFFHRTDLHRCLPVRAEHGRAGSAAVGASLPGEPVLPFHGGAMASVGRGRVLAPGRDAVGLWEQGDALGLAPDAFVDEIAVRTLVLGAAAEHGQGALVHRVVVTAADGAIEAVQLEHEGVLDCEIEIPSGRRADGPREVQRHRDRIRQGQNVEHQGKDRVRDDAANL